VFCDHCGQTIETAGDGNYEWRDIADGDGNTEAFFTHKRCSSPFREAHQAGEDNHWASMELTLFPWYLGNNLKVDWNDAKELARDLAEI